MSIDSDKLIRARLEDAVKMTELKNIPSFLGFLNERDFSECKQYLDKSHIRYDFWGGYENATRCFIAILPDWTDEVSFPFTCLKFLYKSELCLSHRDFLGTLMSLGIERDKVGDIIVKSGEAFVFVSNKIVDFVIENISKVGGVGVRTEIFNGEILSSQGFEDIRKVIASDRADCVVGAICNLSREKAKSFILSGNLIVNHIVCDSITFKIKNNDVLSVRGKGKFVVEKIEDKTQKGRLILQIKKYLWKELVINVYRRRN